MKIKKLYHHQKTVKVHIKIDTGMNRIGLKSQEEFEDILTHCQNSIFQVDGVFTHFATADDPLQKEAYQSQIDMFYDIIGQHSFKYIHCQNSAAMMYHHDERSNLGRIGIAMYGIDPAGEECQRKLKQVMSLYTRVAMIKKVKKGERIGYGLTYTALKDEYIATLPIGYADGLIRANQGRQCIFKDIIIQLSEEFGMDAKMMVKIDENVHLRDRVEIFGEHISLARMAKELSTIPYEIVCLVSERVERIYQK